MNIEQINEKLKTREYDFLKENENLNNNIILLTLGGSHAYGMDKEGSDLDIRGIALNSKKDVLLGIDFEQVVNVDTDTTIYSFNKMIDLLTKSNPNTIECLGCLPEHYLYLSNIGKELIENSPDEYEELYIAKFVFIHLQDMLSLKSEGLKINQRG